jgi:hypothetical protein
MKISIGCDLILISLKLGTDFIGLEPAVGSRKSSDRGRPFGVLLDWRSGVSTGKIPFEKFSKGILLIIS